MTPIYICVWVFGMIKLIILCCQNAFANRYVDKLQAGDRAYYPSSESYENITKVFTGCLVCFQVVIFIIFIIGGVMFIQPWLNVERSYNGITKLANCYNDRIAFILFMFAASCETFWLGLAVAGAIIYSSITVFKSIFRFICCPSLSREDFPHLNFDNGEISLT